MQKATSVLTAALLARQAGTTFADRLSLSHEERHLRRRRMTATAGLEILIDLPAATALGDGDALVLEDGRLVRIEAKVEHLFKVEGRSDVHLLELAWHLGNRHRPTELRSDHLLMAREPVMQKMLEGLGARLTEIEAPFSPVRGAYHEDAHGHDEPGHAHHANDDGQAQ